MHPPAALHFAFLSKLYVTQCMLELALDVTLLRESSLASCRLSCDTSSMLRSCDALQSTGWTSETWRPAWSCCSQHASHVAVSCAHSNAAEEVHTCDSKNQKQTLYCEAQAVHCNRHRRGAGTSHYMSTTYRHRMGVPASRTCLLPVTQMQSSPRHSLRLTPRRCSTPSPAHRTPPQGLLLQSAPAAAGASAAPP